MKELEKTLGRDNKMLTVLRNDKVWEGYESSKYLVTIRNFFKAFLLEQSTSRKESEEALLTHWMKHYKIGLDFARPNVMYQLRELRDNDL